MNPLEDLWRSFAAIEADVQRIKERLGLVDEPKPVREPWPKYNALDQLSLPKSAMDDLVRAVGDSVVREIVKDGGRR
jgi:hypothetical protein